MARTTAGVDFGATLDMSDIAKSLASMPEMTSEAAEKAVRELTKTFDKAAKEAKGLRREVQKANKAGADSFKKLGDTAGDADTAIAGVASALGLISPEAEAAARAIGDLSGGVEGLVKGKSVLATVGVSVASLGTAALIATPLIIAGGLAWKHYADKAEEAREKSVRLRAVLDTQAEAIDTFHTTLTGLSNDLNDAISNTSDAEKAERSRAEAVTDGAEALRKEAKALRDVEEANLRAGRAGVLVGEGRAELNRINQAYSDTLQQVNKDEAEGIDNAENIRLISEAKIEGAEADKASAETAANAAEWASKRAQAEQTVAAALANRLSPLEAVNEAEREVLGTLKEIGATREQMTIVGDEFAQRRADIAEEDARNEVDRLAAILDSNEQEREILQETADKAKAISEKTASDATVATEKANAEIKSQAEAVGASISNVLGMAATGYKAMAEDAADAGKSSAKDLFLAYQAIAIAQAVINTALSISSIWGAFGYAPPVAAALSVIATGVGVANVAAIASESPSFHRGTSGRAPDERSANVLTGEAVLNRQATRNLGAGAIDQMNAGMTGGQGSQTVVLEHRNKHTASTLRDAGRRDGSPIRKYRTGGRGYAR